MTLYINNQSINHFNELSQRNFNLDGVLVAEVVEDG